MSRTAPSPLEPPTIAPESAGHLMVREVATAAADERVDVVRRQFNHGVGNIDISLADVGQRTFLSVGVPVVGAFDLWRCRPGQVARGSLDIHPFSSHGVGE